MTEIERIRAEQQRCGDYMRENGFPAPIHGPARTDAQLAGNGAEDWIAEECFEEEHQSIYRFRRHEEKSYSSFLNSKAKRFTSSGFSVADLDINPMLFPWQREVTRWALRKGRAAMFEGCGCGKTAQELEWAHHVCRETDGSVLIIAPLSVAEQTHIEEAPKFGYETTLCRSQSDCVHGINIANYEMLDHFDPAQFSGVVIDECFPPDTPIDTSSGVCCIQDIRVGDRIISALGDDEVYDVHRREIKSAIRITLPGVEPITSSPNHPYFTSRGWVCAQDLQPGDSIMQTAEAMRLVWHGVDSKDIARSEKEVLRQILLSEMADEATGSSCGGTFCGSRRTPRPEEIGMVQGRRPGCATREGSLGSVESDGRSSDVQKSLPYIEGHEPQTFRAWGKRYGANRSTIISGELTGTVMDYGVCLVTGPVDSWFSNELQARLSASRFENRNRGGWKISQSQCEKGTGREEGLQIGFSRVEGLEVLELGHPDLERYRDANGCVYFYDIGAKRHPSFSVNGLLVHNSGILKSFTGAVKQQIIEMFGDTPYRLAGTATPAPNDYMELGNHAEFLGVMTRTEMLSMFFVHDGGDTGQWRLKGHAVNDFWKWVCSWAVVVRKPSDLGYSDAGYDLPILRRHQITIPAGDPIALDALEIGSQGSLIPMEASTLQERRGARRGSIDARVEAAAKIANGTTEQVIVWCGLNDEADEVTAAIPDAVQVSGSDTRDFKVESIRRFKAGEIRVLVTKGLIFGWGSNLQCCHIWIHLGLSDSFEMMYQIDRRCWRFGQQHECDCYVITSELEGAVVRNINRKEKDFDAMNAGMVEHMRDEMNREVHGATVTSDEYNPTLGMKIPPFLSSALTSPSAQFRNAIDRDHVVVDQRFGNKWAAYNGDSAEILKGIPTGSMHYSIFSPPFAAMYTYSASDRDLGNVKNTVEFFRHFLFIMKELRRVMMPGRLMSFHCMLMPTSKERDGFIGLKDFRGALIRAFERLGFIFHSEVVIWKDPLIAASRTHALGLAHKQIVKDAAMCRQGVPDYLVTMRAPGENPQPVRHGGRWSSGDWRWNGFQRYLGEDREPLHEKTPNASTNKYSHYVWQRYASPVWMDIDPSDTLQRESAREEADERHICPLQLGVIRRALELWTNPDEIVLSPFAGIGSEGYVAIQEGRQFIGIELKKSYFDQCYKNLDSAGNSKQVSLNM